MPRSKTKTAKTEPDYTKPLDGTTSRVFGWCQPSLARPEVAAAIHATCPKEYKYFEDLVPCGCGCHKTEEVADVGTQASE